MKQKQKKYDTSQEIFYKVCETGWNLCLHYLADFAAFKPLYTPAYISNVMKVVKKAEKLSPSDNTLKNIKEIRINMAKAARQVQHNWQALKQYITEASPAHLLEVKLQLAGSSFYKKASSDNWSSLTSLIKMAKDFMKKDFDMLTAKQNMPHAFPAKFADAANKYSQIEKTFFEARIEQSGITNDKIQANNAAYDTLIRMMKDAQQIFRHQPEIKKQFVFSYIVSIYENKNTSTGHVTATDKKPAQNANLLSEIAIEDKAKLTRMKNVA